MNYSSALYSGGQSLEQAQVSKLEYVANLLDLTGGEKMLEIGCGWGALAEHLVRHHGSDMTGVTLSSEQLEYAQARLAGQAQFRLQDYRNCEGLFDRIVSIEMLEAVGERFWPVYFKKLQSCLAADGIAVVQVITIDEARFATYRNRPDFIQRHIFPGGVLPTRTAIEQQAADAGLKVISCKRFGESYARTLAEWRTRFHQSSHAIAALGFDQRFQRMWEYYLSYCEAGFLTGAIDVNLVKIVQAKKSPKKLAGAQ